MRPTGEKPYEVKGGYLNTDGPTEGWGAGFWTSDGFYVFIPQVNGKTTSECLVKAQELIEKIAG